MIQQIAYVLDLLTCEFRLCIIICLCRWNKLLFFLWYSLFLDIHDQYLEPPNLNSQFFRICLGANSPRFTGSLSPWCSFKIKIWVSRLKFCVQKTFEEVSLIQTLPYIVLKIINMMFLATILHIFPSCYQNINNQADVS